MTLASASSARPFFGPTVLRAAFISAVLGWGIGFYGPPVFLYAVISRTGWSLEQVSAAITLHYLWGAIVVARLPRLHARLGVARVTLIGSGLLALGVAGWGLADTLWQLYAAALFSGAGWVTMSAAGINAMLSPWFVRQRPKALSSAYNGASVGGMVFAPLWSFLITHLGFATAASLVGTATFLTMAWLAHAVLRWTPEMLGQRPDGEVPADANPMVSAPQSSAPWAPLAGRALWSNARFLTLAAAMGCSLVAQIGIVSHLYTLLARELGAQGAGWSMTLMTACAVAGRMLFVKWLAVSRDRRLPTCANYAMQMAGLLLLFAAPGPGVLLWCGLVLYGSGIGNSTSLPPLIAQSEFTTSDVPRVVALIVATSQALYAFAPLAFSLLLKGPAGEHGFFGAAVALFLLALTMLWLGRPRPLNASSAG